MDNLTMLILSCDKFSDLWEGHIWLLEKNWPDRDFETIIVTDAPTDRTFRGVKIIAAGSNVEWSDRLAFALNEISTEYVFITLDDYFLIKRVPNEGVCELVNMMENEHIDYVRLFKRPKRASREQVGNHRKVFWVDLNCKYSVNLYSGIWKKSFIESTVTESKSAWNYEVSLTQKAQYYGAKCAVSYRDEFVILDVVRKGKLLHKAASYFKRHPGIYEGDRPVNSWSYEMQLNIQIIGARYLPLWMHKYVKAFLRKRGRQFFSEE